MEKMHTKEPWSYEGFVYTDNGGKVRQIVGADVNEVVGEYGLDDDDARRIVACVNACAGIPNEQLECDNVEFVRIFNERNTLKKQRDELLTNVERCYKMLISEPDTIGALCGAENILREAIASAKCGAE